MNSATVLKPRFRSPERPGCWAGCGRLALGLLLSGSAVNAPAEPTEVTVRVIARGAMFVGDLVDGAHVTISDAVSEEVLAQGVTRGGAGEAPRLMATARERGQPVADETDARFSATIEIDEPRYVRVTAFGPLERRESATSASMTQWVVPGKHLTGGDGWVIELAGFLVRADVAATSVSLAGAGSGVAVEAEVTPMCGCPVKPGFYWDADRYEVAALVRRDGMPLGSYPLRYAGTPNDFSGTVQVELPGVYDITVYAYDPSSGNTGVDRVSITVTDE